MERAFTVGQLARATAVPAKTIRYYEEVGVLPVAHRSSSGYRQYSQRDVRRLVFVRRARALGLSLSQLKVLTPEFQRNRCVTIRPRLRILVAEQLGAVRHQIAEFQALERQLSDVLKRLEMAAPSPDANRCRCLDGMNRD
jgi:MerR family transcriptional regulator, copper efflux regulator